MAVNVRLFAFTGTVQLPRDQPGDFQADSIQQLNFPYVWSQFMTTNGAVPVNSSPIADKRVRILYVEVQDAAAIRFEINPATSPPGTVALPASVNSPRLSGTRQFQWGANMIFSIIDASQVLA